MVRRLAHNLLIHRLDSSAVLTGSMLLFVLRLISLNPYSMSSQSSSFLPRLPFSKVLKGFRTRKALTKSETLWSENSFIHKVSGVSTSPFLFAGKLLRRLRARKVSGALELLSIGLITVFDAILTGRQSGQKWQCLYGKPIANNFFQNWILHNLWIAMLKY